MQLAFICPKPCSALMLPRRAAVHSYTKGSICCKISSSYFSQEMLRCRLPSPRWPYLHLKFYETCCLYC